MFRGVAVCMIAACALPVAYADTYTYGFGCISNNNAVNCAIGGAQLFVDVTAVDTTQVQFRFRNAGPAASSITDVYFDDGTLLGIASIVNYAGVDFSQDATPPDLPSGNSLSPAFETTAGFLADSNPPIQSNGVNPSEQLDIIFNLLAGKTFADTIAALNGPLNVGDDLRIGIHVQGFATGGSETFVNTVTVPEPTSVVLFGTALLGVCHILRKRSAA